VAAMLAGVRADSSIFYYLDGGYASERGTGTANQYVASSERLWRQQMLCTSATHWHQQRTLHRHRHRQPAASHLVSRSQNCLAPTHNNIPVQLYSTEQCLITDDDIHVNRLWVRSIIRLLVLEIAPATTGQVIPSSAPSSSGQCASVQFTDRTRFQQEMTWPLRSKMSDARVSALIFLECNGVCHVWHWCDNDNGL